MPSLTLRTEGDRSLPMLVWRLDTPRLAVSTTPVGGGIGVRHWVLNATVLTSYCRDDPDAHLAELADGLGLDGAGTGFLTAVDVRQWVTSADGGVAVVATVGLGGPAWAAAPAEHEPHRPGTVNVVAWMPVRLGDAALVNAATTVTEAKAQAMWDLGLPATGTATDAVCVLCPLDGPAEPYAGPRSRWGARLARAAHGAIREGGSAWLRGTGRGARPVEPFRAAAG
jgi:adenosylcobinamide amidohydrolase